jgi:hypothetical protein
MQLSCVVSIGTEDETKQGQRYRHTNLGTSRITRCSAAQVQLTLHRQRNKCFSYCEVQTMLTSKLISHIRKQYSVANCIQ